MTNPRIRGKIPHSEWPKIVLRFDAGESLISIARSYECTAPAIRYIVQRMKKEAPTRAQPRTLSRQVAIAASRQAQRPGIPRAMNSSPELSAANLGLGSFWQRVSNDVATFLGAMDSFLLEDTAQNRQAMLEASDALLRTAARSRIEIERVSSASKSPLRVVASDGG